MRRAPRTEAEKVVLASSSALADHHPLMDFHRYGRTRPSSSRATTGDVFVALSRDSWARQMLGEIYRKLFEGEGLRQGSSPDHFIYVTPSKARGEINELAGWVNDRFGAPGSTVPARTPFGYISGPWDGWLTLFAALSYGTDQGLAIDFTESVSGLSWSSMGASRSRSAGGDGGFSTSPSAAPSYPTTATWASLPPAQGEEEGYGYGGGTPPSPPSPPRPPSPPAPEKPGFFDRIFGGGKKSPPPPPPTWPTERVVRPSAPPRAPGEAPLLEDVSESAWEELLARREEDRRIDEMIRLEDEEKKKRPTRTPPPPPEPGSLQARVNAAAEREVTERLARGEKPYVATASSILSETKATKKKQASKTKKTRTPRELTPKDIESEAADVEETLKVADAVRAAEEEEEKRSTVEKLRRPGGSTEGFGL
jgi:hypothetical protein